MLAMGCTISARNIVPEDEIDAYLRAARISSALRLLWVGVVALFLGAVGSWWVWRWLTSGGVMLKVVLAAPFGVAIGVPLTAISLVSIVRALRLPAGRPSGGVALDHAHRRVGEDSTGGEA